MASSPPDNTPPAPAPTSTSPSTFSVLRPPTHALPVADMLAQQLLAAQVMRRFGTADEIFDGTEMRRLRRFVYDPSEATRLAVLREAGMMDDDDDDDAAATDATGDEPGRRKGARGGSLAGYCIARHVSDAPVLTAGDIGALRWWFKELERAGVSLDRAA